MGMDMGHLVSYVSVSLENQVIIIKSQIVISVIFWADNVAADGLVPNWTSVYKLKNTPWG